jgi:hypothetical protein
MPCDPRTKNSDGDGVATIAPPVSPVPTSTGKTGGEAASPTPAIRHRVPQGRGVVHQNRPLGLASPAAFLGCVFSRYGYPRRHERANDPTKRVLPRELLDRPGSEDSRCHAFPYPPTDGKRSDRMRRNEPAIGGSESCRRYAVGASEANHWPNTGRAGTGLNTRGKKSA